MTTWMICHAVVSTAGTHGTYATAAEARAAAAARSAAAPGTAHYTAPVKLATATPAGRIP